MQKIIHIIVISSLVVSSVFGLTLKESVIEVINNNPIIQERIKNFRATQQDLKIAESEYYPSLDLRSVVGFTDAGELKDNVKDVEYRNYENTLTFTQNIFNGFGTQHKVDYQENRVLGAAYNYIEKLNDTVFKMTSAYVNVLRTEELFRVAKDNVILNQSIYDKVNRLYESGLTTDSEVKKVESSLALSKANYIVEKNNAIDNEASFRRILGRMPNLAEMEKPNFNIMLPESIQRAAMYAIENNPSLLVSRYNIKGAQSLYEQKEKEFYPRIDFEVSQAYNGNDHKNNGFVSSDDRFQARIVLNYNLYHGGADRADVQKHISKINQEIEIKRDLKRQVIEGLDLSWNAYEMIGRQLSHLRDYKKHSEKTLSLYREEYDLGRRSLLDLLSAQNDVISAKNQLITAEYERLFATYRILDAMGLLVVAIVGDTKEYTSRVNLYIDKDEVEDVLDTIPVKLDVDNDNIADNLDLCDNSLLKNKIMPYGCVKYVKDSDDDGVKDILDECPLTLLGVKVTPDGCAVDSDKDGVPDNEDECKNTPLSHKVDSYGCSLAVIFEVPFLNDSTVIPDKSYPEIYDTVKFMKENPNYNILLVGHTNTRASKAYNLRLSNRRSAVVRDVMLASGIDESRISIAGKGEVEPLHDNNTFAGFNANRCVEVRMSKIEEEF